MLHRRLLSWFAMLGVMFVMTSELQAAERPKVVASFSILGDMVQQIGGSHVQVTALVGPNGDAHVYQPTPGDALAVANADLVVVNGLGFEGWMERLVSAAGYKGSVAVATQGISAIRFDEPERREHTARHDEDQAHADEHDHAEKDRHQEEVDGNEGHGHHHHGAFDPHAWQSLANARTYVRNILEALTKIDPQRAQAYKSNAERYLAQLNALDAEIRSAVAALPADRRKVVTSHDAFGYFAREYGITFLAPVGMSTESEASAGDVATLIRQIREDHIPAVFVENITDRRLLDQISRETGATIGGTLYSDALSRPEEPAGTYLDMMRHNFRTLMAALGVS